VNEMSPLYLFQVFFKMLLEYMQRRSELENEEFNDIVQQKLEPDMATKFKTIFEVAEAKALEKGKIEGMAIGEEKGKALGEAMSKETLHKAISVLIRTTSLTDKQIAEELGAEESLVKSIRIELKKKN
jgi:flagellar biosynthesis/type III secretory pathway protein FliH